MQSLFIVSLPRTFSTQVYQIASRVLSLQQPSWVMDGEILNVDRYWHYHGIRFDESAKFTAPERDPKLVSQLHEFLDQVTVTEGYIYKDVVQPFVIAQWYGLQQFKVLKIERDVTEIAYSMLQRGWFYPQNAASQIAPLPRFLQFARRVTPFKYSDRLHRLFRHQFEVGVVQGLVRAEQVSAALPGIVVSYDDLVRDEKFLYDALRQLYPDVRLESVSYISKAFSKKRERLVRRHQDSEYRRLRTAIENLRGEVNIK
jgi:hypothetical protein